MNAMPYGRASLHTFDLAIAVLESENVPILQTLFS